ncbi:sodium:solute symporter family transporter [Nocardiopsis coralli]|uniref:sodium:solute symporter family transporter n=1 Tax=Nocardiopsis coralli TaxID=2772213 RepID=UPI001F1F1B19|nr:hypothetical protein [Nocardiopsis coralli]
MIVLGAGVTVLTLSLLGVLAARRVRGRASSYLLAGRALPASLVGAVLMTQAVDANATLGNADAAVDAGFWAGASLPLGLALCLVLAGLFVAGRMNAMGWVTLPEFFRHRYGRAVELAAAVLTVIAFAVLLAGNLVALGLLTEFFLGIHHTVGIALAVPVVLAYTVAGGLFAGVYTGLLQIAVNAVAVVCLTVWTATTHGFGAPEGLGPADLDQLASADSGAVLNWATLLALGLGNLMAIDLMNRIFAARSPSAARRACFIGAGGILVLCLPLTFVALAGAGVVSGGGPVLFVLLDGHAPVWLAVLTVSGLVMASLTTVGGVLLSASAVVVRNVLSSDPPAEGSMDGRTTWAIRAAMVPLAVAGAFVAVRVPQSGILLTLAFDLLLASMVVPFLLGLYWNRGGTAAAVAGIAAGLTVRLVAFVLTPTIHGAENTLLYLPNDLLTEAADGWSTIAAPVVCLIVHTAVAGLTRPGARVTVTDHTRATEDTDVTGQAGQETGDAAPGRGPGAGRPAARPAALGLPGPERAGDRP